MAKNRRKLRNSEERFRSFQIKLLLVVAAIVVAVTAFLDLVILKSTSRTMQRKISDLIAANSRQLELNINSYLERTETISTLLFSDEDYYLYDATDEGLDEYEKIKREENIRDRIVDIGLMENYSDFGIIYSNDHKVGWISHGTQDLFPEGGLYDAFSEYIVDSAKQDGWCFGIKGNTDRMYYIKRLNPNAILVSALYTRELSSVFIYPEQLEEMNIRLVDEAGTILFSSVEDEIGEKIPDTIAESLQKSKGPTVSIIEKKYLINSNTCRNNWRVICSVPRNTILREIKNLRRFTLEVSAAMALLFVLIGLYFITRLSRPVDGMVTSLQRMAEIDRLSGAMNKTAFQEQMEAMLSDASPGRILVFVMLDVDNFKQINDKLGHAYGDQVIIRVGRLLRRLYSEETLIGRLGGDEFALFTECRDVEKKEIAEAAREQLFHVLEEFNLEFKEEAKECGISLSAGVCISDRTDIGFKEIYEKADQALYTSKNEGKARYTVIEE